MRNVILILAVVFGAFGIAVAMGSRVDFAGRVGMAAVFVFTALGHFIRTTEMADMLPRRAPLRKETVVASGLLELALAIGLLLPKTSHAAGVAIVVFLILVAPLNVRAALQRTSFGGHGIGPNYLLVRIPLQVLLIGWTWWFAVRGR